MVCQFQYCTSFDFQGYLWDPSDAPRLNDRNPADLFGAPVYYADRIMPVACMHCTETSNTTQEEDGMFPMSAPGTSWSDGIEGDVDASLEHQGALTSVFAVAQ